MSADPSGRFSTMSRASTLLNRPQHAPMGPRTRNRSSNMQNMSPEADPLPSSPPHLLTNPSFRGNHLYLPEFGPGPAVPEEPSQLMPTSQTESSPNVFSRSPLSILSPLELPEESPPAFEAHHEPPCHESSPSEATPQQDVEIPPMEPPELDHEDPAAELNDDVPAYVENGATPLPFSEETAPPAFSDETSPPTFPAETAPQPPPEESTIQHLSAETSPQGFPEEMFPESNTEEAMVAKTPSSATLSLHSMASSTPSRAPTSSTTRTVIPSQKLTPPPGIKFDGEPVQWKGLTLDAALWTFDSKELQSIVSRAIRSSALESFIRLLTLESLDETLPAELKRLESSKAVTQAKYRFLVHRRTMQLQALLSASSSPPNPRESDDAVLGNTKLVAQLSETVAECDLVVEELLKVTDQMNQIKKLIEHHWASALAIALRKLNGSFGRRSADLSAAREKIAQLEAALEEAWSEAERMAREMDDVDEAMSDDDDTEVIIETAEKVSVTLARATSPSPGPDNVPLPPISLNIELKSDVNGASFVEPSQLSPQLPSLKAKASKENQTTTDTLDSVSIKSAKSTKSAKSAKSSKSIGREPTRSAFVSAARTRSYRASQSSLRLPSGFSRKQSNPSKPRTPRNTSEDLPPVPTLPSHFSPPPLLMNIPSANASSTLLHYDGSNIDPRTSYHMRRTSLDSSCGTYGHRTPLPWTSAMDDTFVGAGRRESTSLGRSLGRENGIEQVPRTPPPAPPKVISLEEYAARPRPRVTVKERLLKDSGSIPSIWMNVDAPKTPAERVESLIRGNSKGKNQTYQRLRTLTKRYSLPFPIFASKSASSRGSEARPSSRRSD